MLTTKKLWHNNRKKVIIFSITFKLPIPIICFCWVMPSNKQLKKKINTHPVTKLKRCSAYLLTFSWVYFLWQQSFYQLLRKLSFLFNEFVSIFRLICLNTFNFLSLRTLLLVMIAIFQLPWSWYSFLGFCFY